MVNIKKIIWPDGRETQPRDRAADLQAAVAAAQAAGIVEPTAFGEEKAVIDKTNLPHLVTRLKNTTQTTAEWDSETSILGKDQLGIEITVGGGRRAKVGDGKTAWADLPYITAKPDMVASIYNPETKVWARVPLENITVSTNKPTSNYTFWMRILEGE